MKAKSKTKSQAIKRKLSAKEIYERSLIIRETEERISSEEEVYKVGNQHVLVRGSETHQLITRATKTQKRRVFYSGEAVLPQEQVLGLGDRHHPAYVQRDGKHIPVYTKNNFGRFIFLYPDGTHVPPRTPLELTVKGDTFTERDGERVCLKRQRVLKKNTLPMFSDIVEPLPTYWKVKRTASLVFDDQNEGGEETVGQDMEAMSDAIAKEAAPASADEVNQGNVTPSRVPEELTNDFSPGTLLLLSELAESLSPSAEGDNDALEGGSAEDILEEGIPKTLSSIPKEVKRKRKNPFLVKKTGELVPDEADVYKVGSRYRWSQGEESQQVIASTTKTQGRYLLYSGEAVLPQEQILGVGNRHHPTYIQKDGKKIPVYRKSYLRKFIFLYPDGTHVPPETPLELVGNVEVYAERNGEQVLLSKERIQDKNALPMFSNIVEPLVRYHQRKEAVEAERCSTPPGRVKEPEQVFSPGTLSLFADAAVSAEIENAGKNWVDNISAIETCEI